MAPGRLCLRKDAQPTIDSGYMTMKPNPIFRTVGVAAVSASILMGCQSLGIVRYSQYMMGKIPDRYAERTNPLAFNDDTTLAGKQLYQEHCALCHGVSGRGDGIMGAQLNPRPANLIMTRALPIASDAFFLWAISEGGGRFETAMPSFGEALSEHKIWKIIQYVKNDI